MLIQVRKNIFAACYTFTSCLFAIHRSTALLQSLVEVILKSACLNRSSVTVCGCETDESNSAVLPCDAARFQFQL